MYRAAAAGNTDEIESLLKAGAYVVATTASGKTVLEYASKKGYEQIAELLRAEVKRGSTL